VHLQLFLHDKPRRERYVKEKMLLSNSKRKNETPNDLDTPVPILSPKSVQKKEDENAMQKRIDLRVLIQKEDKKNRFVTYFWLISGHITPYVFSLSHNRNVIQLLIDEFVYRIQKEGKKNSNVIQLLIDEFV